VHTEEKRDDIFWEQRAKDRKKSVNKREKGEIERES